MKKIVLSFLFSLFLLASHAQQPPAAAVILQKAAQRAALEKKNVFIIFHASWCVWCRRMDTAMSDPSVKAYFDEAFVVEHLTVNETKGKEHLQHPGAEALLEKHGGKNQGIPFWLIFDANLNLLASALMPSGENSGCPASGEEVEHFINVLQKTTRLEEKALQAIRTRFLQNAR